MMSMARLKPVLTGLFVLGALVAAGAVIVLIRAPALPETAGSDSHVGGSNEDSSRSETVPSTSTPGVEREETATAEAAPTESSPPEIDDPPSPAELEDLQFIADQKGISLQEAIERYAWRDNFSLAASRIRDAAPETFAGAEIVDGANAWIAFTGNPPKEALDIIDIFTGSHSGVAVEVRTDKSVTQAEISNAIPAVHYALIYADGVRIAHATFNSDTAQIESRVMLESADSDTTLDDLLAIATERLIAVTRPDILDSISLSVVLVERQPYGVVDGPVLTSPPSSALIWTGMEAIVGGTVVFDENTGCLYLEGRAPVIWPSGASWQADPPAVKLQGQVIELGMYVHGAGGSMSYEWVKRLAGAAVADAAKACADHVDARDIRWFNIDSDVDVPPIYGPVLASPPPPWEGTWDELTARIEGTLLFDESSGCLYLERGNNRYPVVWPAGAFWQADPPAVKIQGQLFEPGVSVYGEGGILKKERVRDLAGLAVGDKASRCAGPNDDIAVFNAGSEVGVAP